MSYMRPSATGWVEGQHGGAVEVQADPPGDAIGPDFTPPDAVPGLDQDEYDRLRREHDDRVEQYATGRADASPLTDLFDSCGEPTPATPADEVEQSAEEDPRVVEQSEVVSGRLEDPREGEQAR